jgi:glutamate--cysteine ligase
LSQLPEFGPNRRDPLDVPITDIDQLTAVFKSCEKKANERMIGIEYEFFGLVGPQFSPIQFEGEQSIAALFKRLVERSQSSADPMAPIMEASSVVAIQSKRGVIALEPGGQIEVAVAPKKSLAEAVRALTDLTTEVCQAASDLDISCLALGIQPVATREQMAVVKKKRYDIMRALMGRLPGRGLDMMTRASATQTNLDFTDETDMVQKMRLATVLSPMLMALMSASPFLEGQPTKYAVERGDIWQKTDQNRTGIPAIFWEKNFGYAAYVQWVLDVPMYFVRRGSHFIDVSGASFREFMRHGLKGEKATVRDFVDHMSTAFTEVRLKPFLEIRSTDSAPLALLNGLQALLWSVFYDEKVTNKLPPVFHTATHAEVAALKASVIDQGGEASLQGKPVFDWLGELLDLAKDGLSKEQKDLLTPLNLIVTRRQSLSDWAKAKYALVTKENMAQVVNDFSVLASWSQ